MKYEEFTIEPIDGDVARCWAAAGGGRSGAADVAPFRANGSFVAACERLTARRSADGRLDCQSSRSGRAVRAKGGEPLGQDHREPAGPEAEGQRQGPTAVRCVRLSTRGNVFRLHTSAGSRWCGWWRRSLVKESQIRELARDLLDLIAAGNHRVVSNFQAIERLASWMAFVVDEAQRSCAAGDGGALKICGLPPQLARMFPIAGVGQSVSHTRK